MIKRLACAGVVLLLAFGCLAGLGKGEISQLAVQYAVANKWSGNYTPHAPIRINNDTDPAWNEFPNRTISNLDINGSGYTFCIYVGNCTVPFTIVNCYLHDMSISNMSFRNNRAIRIESSSQAIVNNNRIHKDDIGFTIVLSSDIEILNNKVENCSLGLEMSLSERIKMGYNLFINVKSGIEMGYSNNCHILNNVFEENHYYLNLYLCNANTVDNNTFSNNGYGIYITYYSEYNHIINNNFINLSGCVFIKESSTLNHLHHNSFMINNETNWSAYDTSGDNFWNTSTEGNFWSDWTGPDNDSDGIVDLPYIIDGGAGAMDHYPLAAPVVIAESPPPTLALALLIILPIVLIAKRKIRK